MASLRRSLRDLCMGPGTGDDSKEEFLVKGRHVIDKDSFSCGVFNGRLVHDWVPHRVLLGLVGIHTLLGKKARYLTSDLTIGPAVFGLLTVKNN